MGSQVPRPVTESRPAGQSEELHRLLDEATARLTARRAIAVAEVGNWESLRERAREIRQHTLERLDEVLVEFERQATSRGTVVHWAATPEAARAVVLGIAERHGVRRVVKGKSMVSEEIHLNQALEQAGIAAVESDLGEFIVQLAGETPSHIIAPALHKSRAEVGRLFADKLGMAPTDDADAMTREARRHMRREFAHADMGTSGANFAIAETGTIVLVENEGNIRLSTSMPRVHVALMGIEKVVPRVSDLPVLLTLLPRSATGQPMPTYVSWLTGPRRPGELDGPDELHVVLLDNGRTRLLADPALRPALSCIRCGACLNACPVYRTIGGHAYRTVYSGPIGSVISPRLEPSPQAGTLPFLSTLCGACAEVCPVKIDLPALLLHLRSEATSGRIPAPATPPGWRWGMRLWAWTMARPWRYRVASQASRLGLRLLARHPALGRLSRPYAGWTAVRNPPEPSSRTFRERWRDGRGV
jgi:L-lactate dehydrogenase complex protein LldF